MGLSLCFFKFMPFVSSFLLFHFTIGTSSNQPLCPDNERSALLHLKESLIIDENASISLSAHPKVASWKLGEGNIDCCLWDGIKCNEETGHVIKLDLSNSYLYGSINSSSSLFHLVHLEWLNLAHNDFNGSEIPSGIMNCPRLAYLNLSNSNFLGQIPLEILQLSGLVSLDLSKNYLTLQNPTLGNLVEKLTNLKTLDLNWVEIPSSIPHTLANMSSLSNLSLSYCGLQGTLPSSLANLTKLVHLDLSLNGLSGELPTIIGEFGSLKELDLSSNEFSGQLPTSIGNLSSLTRLDFSSNKISGELPTSIGNLDSLEYLDISFCNFWGKIPHSLGNLTQLRQLFFSHNRFSGELPTSIANLNSLEQLYISQCNLSGPIPPSLNNLSQLTDLDVSSNNFSGIVELDTLLSKLKKLQVLILSSNNLQLLTKAASVGNFSFIGLGSCNLIEFPNFLQNQHWLYTLDLSFNKLSGQIPEWLLNISVESLKFLNLSHNLLTGFDRHGVLLPWSNLITFDLGFNKLQGPLPRPSVLSFPYNSLVQYQVSNNKLSGEIPPWICNLNGLIVLDLSYNTLSGVLPQCLGNFSDALEILRLRSNNFSGIIPNSFMMGTPLKVIDLSDNLLQGRIPKSMVSCPNLELLDLGNNQIKDTFPFWLGVLSKLNILILRSNKLHGEIREPKTDCGFPKLRIIDLSHNHFIGKLPSKYFECWNAMKFVNTSKLTYMEDDLPIYLGSAFLDIIIYDFSLTMTNKGQTLAYEKISNILVAVILSSNKFGGEIPISIAHLKGLQILNLSNNNFQGHIPSRLGNLTNLESLDLSNNKLSGQIPQQLVELTFLESFDVAHNLLTGPIPQGNQFATFDNSSFEANSGLCGKPLYKKCEKNSETAENEDIHGSKSLFSFDWKIVLIGYLSGLIVGVVLGLNVSTRIQVWFLEITGKKSKGMGRKKRRRM